MKGAVLGAFRLDSQLGSGGMGTVWLASVVSESPGLERGRSVAVKTIHPHLLGSPQYAERFLREAEVGRAIRHPNVVHTFEAGTRPLGGSEVSYLAMEYVAGRTLRQLLEDLGSVPEALLREIAIQISAGLAAIHDQGIVHRDLKPENVLITEDHHVRIMDLGVARLVEQSVALTREGQFAGSLTYAAPEQFRGATPSAASDLYSLGVLLYELATGRNPFGGDDPARVIAAHLEETPPPAPDLTPFFAEILSALLSKAPEDRLPSARELGRVLDEGEDSTWWEQRERAGARPKARRPAVPVRRETAVYGRETEIETLREILDTARTGEGRLVVVEGEAGIGKSRLVDAFVEGIDPDRVTVLYGSYSPSGGLGGLSQAILDHAGTAGVESFLSVEPDLAHAFGRLVKHESPEWGSEPIPPSSLRALFCNLMRGLARKQPLVWIVEDLHFADPDSRSICLALARTAPTIPVLILVTTRPGLPESEIAPFRGLPHAHRLSLDRLSPREVMQLLREAFRSASLADTLGGGISWKSDGVPFFVLEMIRSLREGGVIRELPDGTFVATGSVEELEVPSAVRDLIEARLGELDRRDREILDVGAIEGFEFDPYRVAAVLERNRMRVLQDLADLERRTGLVRGVGTRYRFDHHQIQEVLYEDLPGSLRVECHTALARAALDDAASPEDLESESVVFVVQHHLLGNRPEEAGPLVRRALRHLELASRNEAALDLVTRAASIEALLPVEDRLELDLARARLLEQLGRLDEVGPVLAAADRIAGTTDDPVVRAKVDRAHGVFLIRMNDLDSGEDRFDRAIAAARGGGDELLLAQAIGNKGAVRAMRSDWDSALPLLEESIALARRIGNGRLASNSLGNVGYIHVLCGRFAEAAERYEESLAVAEESGDRAGQAVAFLRLGGLSMDVGRFEEARGRFESALEGFRAVGDRVNEAAAVGSLGNVWHMLGRPREAIESYERGLHLAREIADPVGECNSLSNLGYPYLYLGDTDRGEEVFRLCAEVAGRLEDPILRLDADHGLATVAEYRGERETCDRLYRKCIETARDLSYGLGLLSLVESYAEFLLDAGRAEEAKPLFQESLALANEMDRPAQQVLARTGLAVLGADDPADVFRLYEDLSERLPVRTRMLVRLLLGRATGREDHLREARRIFESLRAQAPDAYRDSIIENVPLHREILGLEPRR